MKTQKIRLSKTKINHIKTAIKKIKIYQLSYNKLK